MSKSPPPEPKQLRQHIHYTVRADTKQNIKDLQIATNARSEGALIDDAVDYYKRRVERLKK